MKPTNTTTAKTRPPTTPGGKTFAFIHSKSDKATSAFKTLVRTYGQTDPVSADIIIVLGGDGFMLSSLNNYGARGKTIFGMNRGRIGFLLNDYKIKGLPERLDNAVPIRLRRLKMEAKTSQGEVVRANAINEIALFRQSGQSAHIEVNLDGVNRLERLVCDGILLATPAGSTAYNLSVRGPIIPLGSDLLALTPISAFRPRCWPGALIPRFSNVQLNILDSVKRPVAVSADSQVFDNITSVTVRSESRAVLNICFEHGQVLQDRILQAQFSGEI